MRAEVEIAMRALLMADPSVPPDGRIDRAVDVLRGIRHDLPDLVRMKELRSILHMSTPSIKNLIRIGRLKKVIGSGDATLGVSRESVRAFIRGEIRLEDGTLVV